MSNTQYQQLLEKSARLTQWPWWKNHDLGMTYIPTKDKYYLERKSEQFTMTKNGQPWTSESEPMPDLVFYEFSRIIGHQIIAEELVPLAELRRLM